MNQQRKEGAREEVWRQWEQGKQFKRALGLYETVQNNENFFIGKQWEGVEAGGLPTPVFNFLKRVVLFLVSSVRSESISVNATPMDAVAAYPRNVLEEYSRVVGDTIAAVMENTKFHAKLTSFLKQAAVRGDGALYFYFDDSIPTGQHAKGDIAVELLDNTRVHFGNPSRREVETQPYILIESRELTETVARRARRFGGLADEIAPDEERADAMPGREALSPNRCTVLLKMWREAATGRIWAVEHVKNGVVRPAWDTGLTRFPLVWMPWDEIYECMHGQSAVSGLIPNQVFVNKMFAMAMISLMSTAYPKIVYNAEIIKDGWDNRVGAAIGVSSADDLGAVARVIEGAGLPPQVTQLIDTAISYTRNFMGAPDASLGDVRPDNASAIVAVQRAAAVPLELVRQNLYQALEDAARILIDMFGAYYGTRMILPDGAEAGTRPVPFDYGALREIPFSLKIDVGASSYWSEIAAANTLDNLFTGGHIDIVEYLERIPDGYLPQRRALIESIKQKVGGIALSGAGDSPISDDVFGADTALP